MGLGKITFTDRLISSEPPPKNTCKGRFYRATENTFINSKGCYIEKRVMTPLKRLSCPGCEQCDWIDDELNEFTLNGDTQIEPDFNNKSIYKLTMLAEYRDWETGYIDDFDFGFREIKGDK